MSKLIPSLFKPSQALNVQKNRLNRLRKNWSMCFQLPHIALDDLVGKALDFYSQHLYDKSRLIKNLEQHIEHHQSMPDYGAYSRVQDKANTKIEKTK